MHRGETLIYSPSIRALENRVKSAERCSRVNIAPAVAKRANQQQIIFDGIPSRFIFTDPACRNLFILTAAVFFCIHKMKELKMSLAKITIAKLRFSFHKL